MIYPGGFHIQPMLCPGFDRPTLTTLLQTVTALVYSDSSPPVTFSLQAKTKGDVIAVMLADKDDADLDARKELWSSVEMLYPKYSCEFFFSTSPEVIKYYSKASKSGLPTIAVITSIGDSGQKRKKKTTHVWQVKCSTPC